MNNVNWTLWLALVVTYCILTYNPLYQLTLMITLSAVAVARKQPLKSYIKVAIAMSAIPLLVNIFLVRKGGVIIYTIPKEIVIWGTATPTLIFAGPITAESTLFAAVMAIFLTNTVTAFQVFNNCAKPDALLRLMPSGYPAAALTSSIALRFIPQVMADHSTIRDAQTTRGVRLDTGPLIQRLGNQLSIIAPTVITSLERSFNLSESMAARGYSGRRTLYRTERWDKVEAGIAMTYVSALLFIAYIKYAGLLEYWPYDSLQITFSALALLPLLALVWPIVLKDERN